MGKIYAILGMSASGKSTIERQLENRGIKRIISCTTRPMREGEVQGKDYYFISDDKFNSLKEQGDLYENTEYRGWHYSISKTLNNIDLENNDYVVVLEPHGYKQLVEKVGKDNIVSFYVYIGDKERLMRSIYRVPNPDLKEICRRYLSDLELFSNIDNEVDYCIENKFLLETTEQIYNIIRKEQLNSIVINVDDKVAVKKINDLNKANHLEHYINKNGTVFSYIHIDGIKKYKVIFKNNESAYFFSDELEIIN